MMWRSCTGKIRSHCWMDSGAGFRSRKMLWRASAINWPGVVDASPKRHHLLLDGAQQHLGLVVAAVDFVDEDAA